MDPMPVEPRWRTFVGMFAILLLILVWCVAVVSVFRLISGWPWPVHALYFLVAGIVWILPLKPLLKWMHTGRWRG
jgi:hypothetical protein